MALNKQEVLDLVKTLPALTDNDRPDLETRIKYVDTQIQEFKKAVWRQEVDLRIAKEYANQNSADFDATARQKLNEVISSLRGLKVSLRVLKHTRADLEAEKGGNTPEEAPVEAPAPEEATIDDTATVPDSSDKD